MKKKFVLTLALVLMVAVTLSAARPIEVSGKFVAGYDIEFSEAGVAGGTANGSKSSIDASFTGDFWKVTINDTSPLWGADKGIKATAELYLDKALKEEGVDLGDVALTLHVGDSVGKGVYTVLADKAGFRDVKLGAKYNDTKKVEGVFGKNFGVTLGYGSLVKVYASMDPTSDGVPMVIAAQVNPVDGVAVAGGFTNAWNGLKALTASAKVDVAALADLDFDLAVTGEYIRDIDSELNLITADVAGGWEGIEAYAAYQMTMAEKHQVAARVGYSTDIDKATVGGGVKYVSSDLAAKAWDVVIDASAEYAFGGATYALAADFSVDSKTFTLSPSVTIKF